MKKLLCVCLAFLLALSIPVFCYAQTPTESAPYYVNKEQTQFYIIAEIGNKNYEIPRETVENMAKSSVNTSIKKMYEQALATNSISFVLSERDLAEWTISSFDNPIERNALAESYSRKKVSASFTKNGSIIVSTSIIIDPNLPLAQIARATTYYTDYVDETVTTADFYRAVFRLSATFYYGTSGSSYFVDCSNSSIAQVFTGNAFYNPLPTSRYSLGRTYSSGREQGTSLPLTYVEILAFPRYQEKFSIWMDLDMALYGFYGGAF